MELNILSKVMKLALKVSLSLCYVNIVKPSSPAGHSWLLNFFFTRCSNL